METRTFDELDTILNQLYIRKNKRAVSLKKNPALKAEIINLLIEALTYDPFYPDDSTEIFTL